MWIGERLSIQVCIFTFVMAEHLVVVLRVLGVHPLTQMLIIVAGLQIIRLLASTGAVERALVITLTFKVQAAGVGIVQ